MKLVFTAAAALAWLTATNVAYAQPQLFEGKYICSLSPTMVLGNIWLYSDGTYVGISRDETDPHKPFEITEGGTINWSGSLGGLDTDGNTLVGTVIKDAGNDKAGFDIQIQLPSGNFSTASCNPDF